MIPSDGAFFHCIVVPGAAYTPKIQDSTVLRRLKSLGLGRVMRRMTPKQQDLSILRRLWPRESCRAVRRMTPK